MINILMVVPNRQDATSFYRSMGPFADMRKQQDFNMIFTDNVDWSILNMVDIVFIQRAFQPQHLELARMCKLWNVPLWVDYDDLLSDIPTDNPAYPVYMNKRTQEDIVQIIKSATLVTVSTPALKDCLQLQRNTLNEHVYVVPNALMDRLMFRQKPRSSNPLVCWRGTNTHQRDLATYTEQIIGLAQRNPKVTWNFVGYNPWFATDSMPPDSVVVAPPMAIGEYFDYMSVIRPGVQIVPLDHSLFNLCKSNIAWIEATLSGAVTVAPDWPEWRRPGVITYKDQESFGQAVDYALRHPEHTKELHAQSMAYIEEHLMLSHVNKTRLAILNFLYDLSRRGHDRHREEPLRTDGTMWPEGGEPTHRKASK